MNILNELAEPCDEPIPVAKRFKPFGDIEYKAKYEATLAKNKKLEAQNRLLIGMMAKYLREEKGAKLKDVAELFGLSPECVRQKVVKLERAKKGITDGNYKEVCFDE